MTARSSSLRPERRTGFTLLEMLAVILIIAILVAIAFPAYNAVMVNARVAAAKSEMSALGTSIAEFKAKFNVEPPSYMDFRLVGGDLQPQTKAFLRQMFPQITFDATTLAQLTAAGVAGEELRSSECLVFFLGGVRGYTDTNGNGTRDAGENLSKDLLGFSKNPTYPFAPPAAGQSNRLGPYFEFDLTRLGEVTRDPTTKVITGFNADAATFTGEPLGYADRLPGQQAPLLYASAAATGNYRPADVPELSGGPYKKSATTYWNPNTFQIISPGFDGQYGVGGVFNPDNTATLNTAETDNLTNFNDGRLGG